MHAAVAMDETRKETFAKNRVVKIRKETFAGATNMNLWMWPSDYFSP